MSVIPGLAALLLSASLLATVPAPEQLQAQADAGDASAQFDLALRLGRGDGFARDQAAAVAWLARAAAGGNAQAQASLGMLLLDSAEDAEQRDAALAWLRSAAHLGNGDAMLQLGVLAHQAGESGTALDHFRRAAGAGDATLQFNVGVMLRDGELAPPEREEAMDWFRAAATQGHAGAQVALGTMYSRILSRRETAYFWLLLGAAADPAAIPLRDRLAGDLGEAPRDIVRASARDWRPGAPGLPHASGGLTYVQLRIDSQEQLMAQDQRWTIVDALARRLAPAQDGEPAGMELLLSPVWIDRAVLADPSTAGMGLAAHEGLAIRLDAAGRALGGMLHDDSGYAEFEFDGVATDLAVRGAMLHGTLRVERSNVVGHPSGITLDVQVSAPLLVTDTDQ
jgi:uncharacterized protein